MSSASKPAQASVVAPKSSVTPPPAPIRAQATPPPTTGTSSGGGTAARPNAASPMIPTSVHVSAAHGEDDDDKPLPIEGWLEKKGHGKMVNDFARR
jgi:hypothetical protein